MAWVRNVTLVSRESLIAPVKETMNLAQWRQPQLQPQQHQVRRHQPPQHQVRRHLQVQPHQVAFPFLLGVVLVRREAGTLNLACPKTETNTAAVVVKDTFARMNSIVQVLRQHLPADVLKPTLARLNLLPNAKRATQARPPIHCASLTMSTMNLGTALGATAQRHHCKWHLYK